MKKHLLSNKLAGDCQAYIDACAHAFDFSGVIALSNNGEKLWAGAAGMACLEHEVPNTLKTKFRLASITKQFTAMAILILHEQGKLNIGHQLRKYYRESHARWKNITIHHLLTHTSGIPSYTEFADHLDKAKNPVTPKALLESFRLAPLHFAPGEKFNYSNSNYVLLGLIIEIVTGMTYAKFLQDSIFGPLGMTDSGAEDNQSVVSHRASGYLRTGYQQFKLAKYLDMSVPYAAGGLYSTATDMLLWQRALSDHSLISPATTRVMFTPSVEGYACGWFIREEGENTFAGHAGGIDGFCTNIERLNSSGLGIVLLSNIDSAPVNLITADLWSILLDKPYSPPQRHKAKEIKQAIFDDYVGHYELSRGFLITISRDGNRLMARATGQSKMELFSKSETEFFFEEIYAQVTFCRDENNAVTHFVLHQNLQDLTAKRLSASEVDDTELWPFIKVRHERK